MKILNLVIAKVWGGGEQYVYDTSKALAAKGVKVYIAVDESNRELRDRFSEVAEVVPVNLYSFAGLKALYRLKKFIKKNDIDFVNCHSGHAMLLCTLLNLSTKAKLVSFKHNALPAKNDFYHKWQRKHTDAFICVSKLVYDLQTKGLSEVEKAKFHLVYNGIDTDKYDKMLRNCKEVKDTSCFNVGYAGRLVKDKGIDVLLRAFVKLVHYNSKLRLFIAGSDEKGYKTELESYIKNNGVKDKVIFLGQVNNMPEFYKKLDVFVLPSVVREAFGLTICEAMYCGVPVITTNSGAQSEIIDSEAIGRIVPSGDVNALADAILDFSEDKNIAETIERAANRVKFVFSANRCASELVTIYEKLN